MTIRSRLANWLDPKEERAAPRPAFSFSNSGGSIRLLSGDVAIYGGGLTETEVEQSLAVPRLCVRACCCRKHRVTANAVDEKRG